MYSRILVPFDGSDAATAGLSEAIKLAAFAGAKLRIVHVVNELILASPYGAGTFDAGAYAADIVERLREEGRAILKRAESAARERGLEPDCTLLEDLRSDAGAVIVRHATEWPADIIVMGTHGRRGLRRMVMGSDAEQVLRTAPVPVLLVRSTKIPQPEVREDR